MACVTSVRGFGFALCDFHAVHVLGVECATFVRGFGSALCDFHAVLSVECVPSVRGFYV